MASALVAVGVNAAMPAKVAADKVGSVAQGDITNVTPLKVNMTKAEGMQVKKHTSVNPLIFKEKKGASKVNKVLSDGGMEWQTLGEADFYDAISVAPLSDWGVERPVYKVEIQESQAQPGYYRLVNIHKNNPLMEQGLELADSDGDSFLIFNTIDYDGVPLLSDDCEYNLLDPLGMEDKFIISQYIAAEEHMGSSNDGVIIFPAGSIVIGMGVDPWDTFDIDENDNTVIKEEYKEKVFFTQEDLVIVLPGATYDPSVQEPDYSFEMYQADVCADNDNKIIVGILEGGADINSYKYLAVGGQYPASEENLQVVANSGKDIDAGIHSFTLNQPGWISFFIVGLNEAGECVVGDVRYYYSFGHNPEEWNSIGHVMLTDDTFGPLYGLDDEVAPVKVEALESKTKPGLYRLVNPYTTHIFADENPGAVICNTEHNHYLDIDASDIEKVTISEAPIGIDVVGDHITVFNVEYGSLVDNKITFPVRGLAVGIYGEQEYGTAFYANLNGRFTVELPCTLSVKVVDVDYEPVADAIVIANGVEATTAENGSANLEVGDVLGTVVTVKVTKDGYKDAEVEADFTETMEANVVVTLTKSTTVGLSLAIIDANKNIKVYDLQGRRVEHPSVGNIYIVDGKKVRIIE